VAGFGSAGVVDGVRAVLDGLIEAAVGWASAHLPDQAAWLAVLVRRSLEYLMGPVRDLGGRYHWLALLAALLLAGWAFAFRSAPSAVPMEERPAKGLRGFLRYCFPRGIWLHRSTWVDVQVSFVNHVYAYAASNVFWRITGAAVASWITTWLTAVFGPSPIAAQWGPVSLLVFTVLMSMAADFGYFLFHWASHRIGPLWEVHKLHHSAEVLSPLTAARVHPFERIVMGPIKALTTGIILAPAVYLYAGETATLTFLGLDAMAVLFNMLGHVLHHSHVWLYYGPVVGRVVISPAQHQIHHSTLPQHIDRNFGEHWALWDWMFGTLYLPKGKEELKFGLAGVTTQPHGNVAAAFLRPVADSARSAAGIAWRLARRAAPPSHPGPAQPPLPEPPRR
jgi:sterol desaturase/sphingolipid hydroxylase (fatty acid hydroxylase superfamily)